MSGRRPKASDERAIIMASSLEVREVRLHMVGKGRVSGRAHAMGEAEGIKAIVRGALSHGEGRKAEEGSGNSELRPGKRGRLCTAMSQ